MSFRLTLFRLGVDGGLFNARLVMIPPTMTDTPVVFADTAIGLSFVFIALHVCREDGD
jgi:hypothetical protein